MIALLLAAALQAAPATDAMPLAAIGPQALPTQGCAAFLWSAGADRRLVAMASADPAQIRLSIDGRTIDVARVEQSGVGGFGFGGSTTYRGGEVSAMLDMTIVTRADLSKGAVVTDATLRIDRAGRDTVVLPVGGLVGCA